MNYGRRPYGLSVSPDGRTLYVIVAQTDSVGANCREYGSASIYEFDTASKTLKRMTKDGGFWPSLDGKLLLGGGGGFRIWDALTQQVIYTNSSMSPGGLFAWTAPLIYIPTRTAGQLLVFDYQQFKLVDTLDVVFPNGNRPKFYSMRFSRDDKYLYFVGGEYIGFYDLSRKEIVRWHLINSKFGQIASTKRFIYVTDPGGGIFPPPPTRQIYVFDAKTFDLLPSIRLDELNAIYTDAIVVTPDLKKAFVSTYGLWVLIVDTKLNLVTDTVFFSV